MENAVSATLGKPSLSLVAGATVLVRYRFVFIFNRYFKQMNHSSEFAWIQLA
jgi:hypothetical protein